MNNPSTKPGIDKATLLQTIDAVTDNRALGEVTVAVKSRATGGTTAETSTESMTQAGEIDSSRRGKFTVNSDEPVPLMGTDTAVSPAEYVMHALAGCYVVTLGALAAHKDIQLDKVELELELDADLAGFLGVDETVRKGAREIRVQVDLEAQGVPEEDLQALVAEVEDASFVRDMIANPVNVVTTVA